VVSKGFRSHLGLEGCRFCQFFCWDILVICFAVVWKLAITVFISLHFQTLWPKWLNFFGHFKNILVYNWKKRVSVQSFVFTLALPLGEGCGDTILMRAATSQSTAISGSSAGSTTRWDQLRSEMWSLPVRRWPLHRLSLSVTSRLASPLSWGILDTSPTNIAGISQFRKVAPHSQLYEFHSCMFCHKLSHYKLWKNPIFLSKDRFENW